MIFTLHQSLRNLKHSLIRWKLIREHGFGQVTLTYRLLHIRPFSGLVLSAPALLLVLWYSSLAVSTHLRQDSAVKADEKLTPELFQLHLHDRLMADYRRLRMPEPRVRSELPTYNLVVNDDRLGQLALHFPPDEGRVNYVPALLQNKNRVYEVEVRYRGTKHWHWNNPQKSWKVRVKDNHLMFDGLPTFNFVNTPDPIPFYEQMVLDIARDAGLLTPSYYPFRLQLNRAFLGVYFFEAQPDEGLLRQSRRMPGSIYSGQGAPINPKTGVSSLWDDAKTWKKVGSIGDGYEQDLTELDALLKALQSANARQFADFAETALDLDKFATLDALDVVFGNNQHDYHQNHKLYFDPYRNRFEPIATDFRDMEHERLFNRTEHPLLLRLKQLPAYISRRNRKVYEFLTGACSTKAITSLTRFWTDVLEPDQARDPYWDAFELLPVMGTYYRQLVRPMNEERQTLATRMRLQGHATRLDYLRQELEHAEFSATFHTLAKRDPGATKPAELTRVRSVKQANTPLVRTAVVDVTVGGAAGFDWQKAVPEFADTCVAPDWQLYADRDLDQQFSPDHDQRLPVVSAPLLEAIPQITLYPGVALKQIPTSQFRGRVRADAEPRRYRFFVRSPGCTVTGFTLYGKNTVTGGGVTIAATHQDSAPNAPVTACNDGPGFIEPNSSSLHPFCYPLQTKETVHIGPGLVELRSTEVYSKHQTVVIEPGTTIRAAKNASLITYGRLQAEGTPDAKIRFVPAEDTWGGLALQGADTAGSRMAHTAFTGGTKPSLTPFTFPGMVNIHDTRDVQLAFVEFSHNQGSDDALHVAYVDGFVLRDAEFRDIQADALDLEYTSGEITHLDVCRAGDDGLDLMGSKVRVSESRFIQCKGNGLSIGERSEVFAHRDLIARGQRGILIKNASALTSSEILTYENHVGIRLEPEALWYEGTSRVALSAFHVVRTKHPFDGSKSAITGEIHKELHGGALPALRQDTLGIADWDQLEPMLDRCARQGTP